MNEIIEIVKIKIPNTRFLILGEQKENKLWDIYIINPRENYKEILKKDLSTRDFSTFSNITLKSKFPHKRINNYE